jgi:formate-dependent nitrite reductase membrane component NrfD
LDIGPSRVTAGVLDFLFVVSVLAHVVILIFENVLTSSPSRHHELAVSAIRRGAYAPLFWGGAIGAGGVVPLLLASGALGSAASPVGIIVVAAVLALAGGAVWDYIWVDAGQSVPLS